MSSYGVLSSGFLAKDSDAVLTTLQGYLTTNVNAAFAAFAAQPTSLIGQVAGVTALVGAELWEVAEAIHAAGDPDSATGAALDYIGVLRGITRTPATKSTVSLTVNLNAVTTLPIGQVVSNSDDSTIRFVTTAAVTSTTAGNYTVAAEAEVSGPVASDAGKLTVIDSPVSGWNSVTNASAATVGADRETDTAYRQRMAQALATAGSATLDAIRSALLADDGITQAAVFENTTQAAFNRTTPSSFTVDPGGIEAVVVGTSFTNVPQILFDEVAAGIGTYGASSGSATDAQGNTYTRYYTEAPSVDVDFVVVVSTDGDYPADGDDQIDAAIDAYVASLLIGQDVVRNKLYDVIFNISGVTDVTTLTLNGGTSNITVDSRSIAAVNSVSVTS